MSSPVIWAPSSPAPSQSTRYGLDDRPVPATIEAMATEHLARMRELQPRGPYFLGGYCNGGLMAYEVARRLATAGEPVEPVVLIAAAADVRLRWLRPLLDQLAGGLGLSETETADYFGRVRYLVDRLAMARLRRKIGIATASTVTLAGELLARLASARRSPFTRTPIPADAANDVRVGDGLLSEETYARHFSAVMAYVPRAFRGRVLAFWPTKDAARQPGDPTLGWGALVEHVDVVRVPGDHQHTIVTRHIELIAREIQARRPVDLRPVAVDPD